MKVEDNHCVYENEDDFLLTPTNFSKSVCYMYEVHAVISVLDCKQSK